MTEEQEQDVKEILKKYLGPKLIALAANVPKGLSLKDSLLKYMATEIIEQAEFYDLLENIQVVEHEIDNESEEARMGIRATGPNANSILNPATTNTGMESCKLVCLYNLLVLLVQLEERTESRCEFNAAPHKDQMITKAMFPTDVKAAMEEDKFEPEELTRNRI
ncbi:unnamed protein product [Allacma fusca]|uniref:Uncharacterized protein n=1 Tax=Allacma fusca TaxID=39272 RepID=A0A8J2PUZ9_9HEXA|nr:unnamed protein product [Allacma fusca]